MKCFFNVPGFMDKVNYVDENNVVLGYDMNESCCEQFGHGVFASIPKSEDEAMEEIDIEKYSFSKEIPTRCLDAFSNCGGGMAFRICTNDMPDMYIVLWNYHNGYYSHWFDFLDYSDSI